MVAFNEVFGARDWAAANDEVDLPFFDEDAA